MNIFESPEKGYKNFRFKIKMGNVNVRMQKNKDALSGFQIAKLTFDFNTFFDLNKDGYLSYKVRQKLWTCSGSYGGSEPASPKKREKKKLNPLDKFLSKIVNYISDSPCKNGNARFTTIPLKPISHQ